MSSGIGSGLTRRDFVRSVSAGIGALALNSPLPGQASGGKRPNILWIVSEDNDPFLGCYGNKLVHTPNIDRLASEGILYENCFSQAPVCAPSRFTLISGMYASSCGPAHQMRAQGKIPRELRGFPAYLREAGYYCTNNAKTDYNAPINLRDAWDECSNRAHWRNRPKDKPFFSVFNHEVTHEGQLFPANYAKYKLVAQPVDPAKVELPPYHPDTPEFRRDWANYFDHMSRLDTQVARLLAQLEEDGLAEDTIVFYYSDNGGILPRSKRFCHDSGLHVPLVIRFPKKYRHLAPADPGGRIDSPVSFVDFAPTILSLAGVEAPGYMQGHAFAGPKKAPPQEFAFGFRNRMDERYDNVRTVRDKRYRYIRNYMPHIVPGVHQTYQYQMRSMQVWYDLHLQGKLNAVQDAMFQEKPAEEFYDTQADPHEIHNLIASPEHQARIQRMRAALDEHMLRTRDNGLIPEGSPIEGYLPSQAPKAFPIERVLEVANTVIHRDPAKLPKITEWLADENECVRYWAAMGCVMLHEKAAGATDALLKCLNDPAGSVRVAAAEALCSTDRLNDALKTLEMCLKDRNPWVRLQAANALDNIGPKAKPLLPAIELAMKDPNDGVQRMTKYTAAVLSGRKQ